MALSFQFGSTQPLGLDEYVDWISHSVDVHDYESLAESASKLHALSKDKNLLHSVMHAPLHEIATNGVQAQNTYTDATFLLFTDPTNKFFIRANVWKMPNALAGSMAYENRLYSYHMPHDHNFDFLTVGYFGPGYRTVMYEYDRSLVEGWIGEPVDLRFTEDTMLPEGKVMLYKNGVDIHEQHPPESMSISVNLMVPGFGQKYEPQYEFDLEKGCISHYVDGHSSTRVSLLDMAAEIGDENTAGILLDIASRNPCPRTRASAYKGFMRLVSTEQDATLAKVLADRSVIVRNIALEFSE